MALATKELGFEYFVICDHSQTAVYANGLNEERVLLQHKEIDNLNEENLGIKILKGIESDILPDGSLDYKEDILHCLVTSNNTIPIGDYTFWDWEDTPQMIRDADRFKYSKEQVTILRF